MVLSRSLRKNQSNSVKRGHCLLPQAARAKDSPGAHKPKSSAKIGPGAQGRQRNGFNPPPVLLLGYTLPTDWNIQVNRALLAGFHNDTLHLNRDTRPQPHRLGTISGAPEEKQAGMSNDVLHGRRHGVNRSYTVQLTQSRDRIFTQPTETSPRASGLRGKSNLNATPQVSRHIEIFALKEIGIRAFKNRGYPPPD